MGFLIYIILVGLLFLGIIFFFNKNKMPIKHYLKLAVIGGILAIFVSLSFETYFKGFLRFLFLGYYEVTSAGITFYKWGAFIVYYFIESFLMIAPIEEISKNVIAYWLNEKTEHKFLSYIECVMPFLIMGMAFAIVEDYFYIENYEDSGLIRLQIFLPGHPMFAIIFGHFYYKYRVDVEIISMREIVRRECGKSKPLPYKGNKYIKRGIIFVCLLHGLHNFISITNGVYFYVMYIAELIIFLFVTISLIENRKRNVKQEALYKFMRYYSEYSEEQLKEWGIK